MEYDFRYVEAQRRKSRLFDFSVVIFSCHIIVHPAYLYKMLFFILMWKHYKLNYYRNFRFVVLLMLASVHLWSAPECILLGVVEKWKIASRF